MKLLYSAFRSVTWVEKQLLHPFALTVHTCAPFKYQKIIFLPIYSCATLINFCQRETHISLIFILIFIRVRLKQYIYIAQRFIVQIEIHLPLNELITLFYIAAYLCCIFLIIVLRWFETNEIFCNVQIAYIYFTVTYLTIIISINCDINRQRYAH